MSVPVECNDCGGIFEVGLGDEEPDLCNECAKAESRLANGGLPLSAEEQAALARFADLVVPRDEGVPFDADGGSRRMVWNEDGDGFLDLASERDPWVVL